MIGPLLKLTKIWVIGMTLAGALAATAIKQQGTLTLFILAIVLGFVAPPIHLLSALQGEGPKRWQRGGFTAGFMIGIFNGVIWLGTYGSHRPADWDAIEHAMFFGPILAAPLIGVIAGRLADRVVVVSHRPQS